MIYVVVYKISTGEEVKRIECSTERKAERVENGILMQMNLEDYYTEIVNETP